MDTEEFAKYLEGKTLEEIVHKAKKESEKRMLAQGMKVKRKRDTNQSQIFLIV